MKELTDVQKETVCFIHNFTAQHGHAPTFRDCAENANITVGAMVQRLRACHKKGAITWVEKKSRTLRITE